MQYKYAFILFLTEHHISILEVGRKKRKQCYDIPWWGTKHLWAIREYNSRSICELCFISKSLQNLQVTKIRKWDEMTLFQSHSTSQPLNEDMLATPQIPQVWGKVFGINLMLAHILNSYVYVYFILTFTRDEQRSKCGGACWQSLTIKSDHQLRQKEEKLTNLNTYAFTIDKVPHVFGYYYFVGVDRISSAVLWGVSHEGRLIDREARDQEQEGNSDTRVIQVQAVSMT